MVIYDPRLADEVFQSGFETMGEDIEFLYCPLDPFC